MTQVAAGITQLRAALSPDDKKPEVKEILTRFDVPSTDMTPEDKQKREEMAQTPKENGDGATISSDGESKPGTVD